MSHPRTTLALALGLAAASVLAYDLGGSLGTGVVLGYLLGAALCAFGVAWQSHWLRVSPRRAMQAQVEGFLAKLAALCVFAVAFRFLESLAAAVDWRAFVVAYAGAIALLLPLATYESTRRHRSATHVEQRSAP
jgi:hypothetical protein